MCTTALSVACGRDAPSHPCPVRGHLDLADGTKGLTCTMDMFIGTRPDVLLSIPVTAGSDVSEEIHFPILDPSSEWHALLTCPGYQPKETRPFVLGKGWRECAPADFGRITLEPLAK
jgi:hypothetical protein